MSEYRRFKESIYKNRCRACLKVVDEVFPMTPKELNAYQIFTYKARSGKKNMVLCLICKWMLRKCMRFILQIQRACQLMNEAVAMGINAFSSEKFCKYDIGITTPSIHYLGPESNIGDQGDLLMNEQCGEDDVYYEDDEEEVPLVMLIDYKCKNKKPDEVSIADSEVIGDGELNPQIIKIDEKPVPKKKKKKVVEEVKEGFSSRMVRETDEYVVIKLTNKEVIEEMEKKAKTETYLRYPFKCDKCVKGFNFQDVLSAHMKRHKPEYGTYKCVLCGQYCPNPVSLRGHMKSHTTRYKCKICGQIRLSRQHLLEHYTINHTSTAPEYTCNQCDFTTAKRTVMQRHVKSHEVPERHPCETCGKVFNNLENLRVHSMRHDKTKRLQCSHCKQMFLYPSLLQKHIKAVHESKEYYCVECDVKFKSPDSLRLHFRRAKKHRDSSSYKYECNHCDQRFISKATLAVHMNTTHGQPKQHACDICNNRYSSKEALRAHIWRVHSQKKEQPANCHLCEKSFTRKSILKVHVRTHTGERPHVCMCGAAFTQRTTLRAHQAAKHSEIQKQGDMIPLGEASSIVQES